MINLELINNSKQIYSALYTIKMVLGNNSDSSNNSMYGDAENFVMSIYQHVMGGGLINMIIPAEKKAELVTMITTLKEESPDHCILPLQLILDELVKNNDSEILGFKSPIGAEKSIADKIPEAEISTTLIMEYVSKQNTTIYVAVHVMFFASLLVSTTPYLVGC